MSVVARRRRNTQYTAAHARARAAAAVTCTGRAAYVCDACAAV